MPKSSNITQTLEKLVPYQEFPYASYVPGRGYKRHTALGYAKAAIKNINHDHTALFKFDRDLNRWVQIPKDT